MQSPPQSYDVRIREFENLVGQYFGFLSEAHDFSRRESRAHDLDSPIDAAVTISFDREDLRVSIGLGLAGANGLGITIRDNRWHTRSVPADGSRPVKSSYFESLVAYLTDGVDKPLVPLHGEATTREVNEAALRVAEDLESVVAQLAAKLAKHATRVLHADIPSQFAAAADYRDDLRR